MKAWFAQFNWAGVGFINFVIFLYIGWSFYKKKYPRKTIYYAVAVWLAVNAVLWFLGLRY